MKIDAETFEEWQAHPVTEALFRLFSNAAAEAKQTWVETSWHGEKADPVLLARMRERASTFEQLSELTRETLEET